MLKACRERTSLATHGALPSEDIGEKSCYDPGNEVVSSYS